jgi:hypothetical protein
MVKRDSKKETVQLGIVTVQIVKENSGKLGAETSRNNRIDPITKEIQNFSEEHIKDIIKKIDIISPRRTVS